jgi:DNA-binding CsgD family transcriptional regulator
VPSVLGIDSEVLRVYETLLELGPAASDVIARRCGTSEAEVDEALAELNRLELALPQGSQRWAPTPPDLALGGLLLDHRQELDRAEAVRQRLRARYAEVEAAAPHRAVLEVVEGPAAIGQRLHQLERTATRPLSSSLEAAAGPEPLDPVDRQLLSLLLAGYTDAAVARQLELSERTVHGRISALMLTLGVGTRIQLGWQVRDHGWL